jgi:hypothetical protein
LGRLLSRLLSRLLLRLPASAGRPPAVAAVAAVACALLRFQNTDDMRLSVHELRAQSEQPLFVRVGGHVPGAEELFDQRLAFVVLVLVHGRGEGGELVVLLRREST